ncbi:hypothetical protein BCR44DRAFT_1006020 [Catenaria anguillulae PL171]|uniref:Uncharacterized protein n=1 Tax=Catenaria anguillulae PL171 TaxID=765915 RepID=A0A1Y2I5Q3_9FUNG|nr:hypothetical protein BCR44DRAFT_1006020 [Catenaria anguillulae PL171]
MKTCGVVLICMRSTMTFPTPRNIHIEHHVIPFSRNPPSSDHRACPEIKSVHPAPLPRPWPTLQSPTHSQQPFTATLLPSRSRRNPESVSTQSRQKMSLSSRPNAQSSLSHASRLSRPSHHAKTELGITAEAQVKSEYFKPPNRT